MAYSKDNLFLHGRTALDGSYKEWIYRSADPIATVNTAGYISNAKKMGMGAGNIVHVIDTVNNLVHLTYVVSVNATTGVADLYDGTALSSTNTD